MSPGDEPTGPASPWLDLPTDSQPIPAVVFHTTVAQLNAEVEQLRRELAPLLEARPEDSELLLDKAQNHEALGQHREAAAVYAKLARLQDGRRRLPKFVYARAYHVPFAYFAARAYDRAAK